MSRALWLVLPLSFALTGCGDKDDDDDGGDTAATDGSDGGTSDGSDGGDGTDGTDGTAGFTVAEGHWTISDGSLVYDNCGAGGDELPASDGDGYAMSYSGDSAFNWTFDATGDVANCTFSDERNYTCAQMSGSEPIDDFDITIQSTIDIVGVYVDERSTSGEWLIWIDCSGDDCWLAELESGVDFPCDVRVAVQAAAD